MLNKKGVQLISILIAKKDNEACIQHANNVVTHSTESLVLFRFWGGHHRHCILLVLHMCAVFFMYTCTCIELSYLMIAL